MLPLFTSQAIALSHAKEKSNKPSTNGQRSAAPRASNGFFTRMFDALFEAQERRAQREIERHRRFHEGDKK